jgi:hypothetical protein
MNDQLLSRFRVDLENYVPKSTLFHPFLKLRYARLQPMRETMLSRRQPLFLATSDQFRFHRQVDNKDYFPMSTMCHQFLPRLYGTIQPKRKAN